MSPGLSDDESALVQAMTWFRVATSHNLSQCWPSSLSPCGVNRPQWVKIIRLRQMSAILQKSLSNSLFWKLCILIQFSQPRVHLAVRQHCFRQWLGTQPLSETMKSHEDPVYWGHMASLGHQPLKHGIQINLVPHSQYHGGWCPGSLRHHSPRHQHPRYWLCRTGKFLSYLRRDFNYLCHVNVEEWHPM